MTRRQCVEQVDYPSGCPECARLKERMGCLQRKISELQIRLNNAEVERDHNESLLRWGISTGKAALKISEESDMPYSPYPPLPPVLTPVES